MDMDMDMEMSAHSLRSSGSSKGDVDPAIFGNSSRGEEFRSVLRKNMLGNDEGSVSGSNHRILSFKEKAPAP